jgi:hypothetical protein
VFGVVLVFVVVVVLLFVCVLFLCVGGFRTILLCVALFVKQKKTCLLVCLVYGVVFCLVKFVVCLCCVLVVVELSCFFVVNIIVYCCFVVLFCCCCCCCVVVVVGFICRGHCVFVRLLFCVCV